MEVNIRIAGAAGQGIQTAADLLGRAAMRGGLHVYHYSDAESRIRGGLNFSHLRIANRPLAGVSETVDVLVALSEDGLRAFGDAVDAAGMVLCKGQWSHPCALPFHLDELARQAGSSRAEGVVAVAVVAAMMGLAQRTVSELVEERFVKQTQLMAANKQAVELGFAAVRAANPDERFRFTLASAEDNRLWISGGQATALGAVAGGVSFLAAYPMSPATSVMTNLAQWAAQTGVIVEQAEDEIAAINMVAGASYAGARAMTATSGGGFALMTEGISLLGMIEAPAVIVLAQRPGPATGLPTRSAQGDLHLALHAGHGHVPRVIFAPEDIADCLHLTAIALDIAERFQTPVLILTDQLLMDSQTALPPFDVDDLPTERHFLSATQLDELADYHRFAVTADGVSPLAAPGASRHVVVASSDEHDEAGHIADSVEIATRMAQKRLDKERTIATQVQLPLTLSADPAGRQLVLSWGSAKHTVAEALSLIDNGRFAHLNLRQLWPFPAAELTALMERATGVIVVENNVTGELARLVRAETLRAADTVVTKLNGRPLTVQELVRRLRGEV